MKSMKLKMKIEQVLQQIQKEEMKIEQVLQQIQKEESEVKYEIWSHNSAYYPIKMYGYWRVVKMYRFQMVNLCNTTKMILRIGGIDGLNREQARSFVINVNKIQEVKFTKQDYFDFTHPELKNSLEVIEDIFIGRSDTEIKTVAITFNEKGDAKFERKEYQKSKTEYFAPLNLTEREKLIGYSHIEGYFAYTEKEHRGKNEHHNDWRENENFFKIRDSKHHLLDEIDEESVEYVKQVFKDSL